jgi:outer membrane receptor protein involved in Fe transport
LVSGITANASYRIDAGRFGSFKITGDYNTTLKHEYRQFPTDPITDLLHNTSYYNQFKDIGAGTLTWDIGSWSTTVRGTRYGKSYSYDGTYTVAPWMLYNATVQYNFSDDAALTLITNNVFNSRPPLDHTYSAYPYYNIFNYNSFGRLVMLEMNVHFGGGKKN